MTDPAKLASARRAYVIAAAGCGKTHMIADAVECTPDHRQLILTHTNAGVDVLRRRLTGRGVPDRRAHVETISGFALRYAAAYPRTCQVDVTQPTGEGWRDIQLGATRFFATRAGRAVIADSYGGLYVDEYQDCTQFQHGLIRELAEVLPTRLMGDPMQAIFDFAGEPLVNFSELASEFERLDDLTVPWRWAGTNPQLGDWLLGARADLLAGRDPDFRNAPVRVRSAGDVAKMACTPEQVNACKDLAGEDSVVAIRRLQHAAHQTASKLRGTFSSMEEIDCRDLFTAADNLDKTNDRLRALALLEFASRCMTKVSTYLGPASKTIARGKAPATRNGRAAPAIRALVRAAADDTPANLLGALREMSKLPDAVLYRAELYDEMCRTLRRVSADDAGLAAIRAQAEERAARDRGVQELAVRHAALGRSWLAMEAFYREQEAELEQTMEARRDWERATEQTRRLAVAADTELRRRHPGQRFDPLRSAEPVVSDDEREQLVLAPGAEPYRTPEWITRLAAERRAVRELLDERKGVRIPSEDPDYEHLGEAWPAWVDRDRDAILQPPKPEMRPAPAVAVRIAEMQAEPQ